MKKKREKVEAESLLGLAVIDCLAVVSKGTAMLYVEVAVTLEFAAITFGYGLKLAGI